MSYKTFVFCLVCMPALHFMLLLQSASAQGDTASLSQLIERQKPLWGGKVAVMVWKDNKVVYQKFSPDLGINTQQPVGYASSWMTAALVMTFVDQGKLSLDHPVSR